jgi:hypothetical protein
MGNVKILRLKIMVCENVDWIYLTHQRARLLALMSMIWKTIHGSTAFVDLGRFFGFLMYTQSVGLLKMGDQPVARSLPTHRTTETQNKCRQTSMPGVGFENTIPVFERAKTFHTLDRATTGIGVMENQVSIKHRKYLDKVSDCQLLKNGPVRGAS